MFKKLLGVVVVIGIIIALSLTLLPKKTTESDTELPNPTSRPTTTASITNTQDQKEDQVSKTYSNPPEMQIDSSKNYSAAVQTSAGPINIKLFAKDVPNTVNNFTFLAKENFYDGTKFHRIIETFMIQGGDPKGDGTGGPGYKFADEPISLDYTRGIVAMANSGPNTNGSQFFIVTRDTDLPKNYVIFGELVGEDSLATLDKIAATPVTTSPNGENSKPTQDVTITSIEVSEK